MVVAGILYSNYASCTIDDLRGGGVQYDHLIHYDHILMVWVLDDCDNHQKDKTA